MSSFLHVAFTKRYIHYITRYVISGGNLSQSEKHFKMRVNITNSIAIHFECYIRLILFTTKALHFQADKTCIPR